MNTKIEKEILRHAEDSNPKECCGVLVAVDGQAVYIPCANQAKGTDHFILAPEDYAAADSLGEIVGVVHSHPDARPKPSDADRAACEASGLPWHIVSWPGKEWAYLEPCGFELPPVGRVFAHGVVDCWTTIQDWYKREHGRHLPNFERQDDWWYSGGNLYVENYEAAGFRCVKRSPVSELDVRSFEVGDMIIMQILSNVPNHSAIYLGNNKILHHLHGRLSCEEVYGGYYRKHTTHICRLNASESDPIGGTG